MAPIKILLCSPMTEVGGISKWTLNILSYYKNRQSNDLVLKWYYTNQKSLISITQVKLLKRIYNGIRLYIPFLMNLKKKLKKEKYDIVHFSTSASISLIRDLLTIYICKKENIKTIVHFHFGRIPQIYQSNSWECKLLNKVLSLVDIAITMDMKSYNTLVSKGYHNVKLVPNPLSDDTSFKIKNINVEYRDEKNIVFVGHVIETKGVFELVKACKGIPNICVKLLGDYTQDMYKKLYEIADEKDVHWLYLEGNKPFEDVLKEMKQCGVFVLPTYTEGFPNVIIESMACECPIVTTPVGAIPEMLDIEHGENCGICVPPKNVEKLKDAIEKMLNDREYALQCGKNAQERVNQCYSMPIVWNQLVDIWNETLTR